MKYAYYQSEISNNFFWPIASCFSPLGHPIAVFSGKPLIVGSVGPYGASLHDGSEYTGSYAKTTPIETIREWHIPRIKALVEAGVDLLALETIPCKVEAETLVTLLKEQFPNTRAWLTFSVGVSTYRDNWFVKVVSIPPGTVFLNECFPASRALAWAGSAGEAWVNVKRTVSVSPYIFLSGGAERGNVLGLKNVFLNHSEYTSNYFSFRWNNTKKYIWG